MEPPFSNHQAVSLAKLPGMAAGVTFITASLLGKATAWRLSTNVAAYGLVGTTCAGLPLSFVAPLLIRRFLSQQGVEVPTQPYVDRRDHTDVEDVILTGAFAGAVVAGRLLQPWTVFGWKRWVGAGGIGIFAAEISWVFYLASTGRFEQHIKRRADQKAEAMKWREEHKIASAHTTAKSSSVSEQSTTAMPRHLQQAKLPTLPASKSLPSSSKLGFDKSSWTNLTNEPHLTDTPGSGSDPLPYANKNYLWQPTPGHEIRAIEDYISKIRRRREELANESQYLWYWLAQKEAEYYSLDSTQSTSEDGTRKRRYLEALGNLQTKVWIEVSKYDWMLADSQKHIEQLQSAENQGNGHVSWLPHLSNTAASTEPTTSKALLEDYLKQNERRTAQVKQTRQEFASVTANPNLKLREGLFQSEVDGRWANAKDLYPELL